mgnify:CR=1 FL=1
MTRRRGDAETRRRGDAEKNRGRDGPLRAALASDGSDGRFGTKAAFWTEGRQNV